MVGVSELVRPMMPWSAQLVLCAQLDGSPNSSDLPEARVAVVRVAQEQVVLLVQVIVEARADLSCSCRGCRRFL